MGAHRGLWASLAVAAALTSCRSAGPAGAPPTAYQAGRAHWSDWSNKSADAVIEKYGPPDRVESKSLVWEDKGRWKRIAVQDRMDFHQTHDAADNIEQTLAYPVPDERREALARLSGRVSVSHDGSELSARSWSEENNLLALNLADEVIRGVKTPDEANDFYAATLRLAAAGKSSPYMRELLFTPPIPSEPPP